MNKCSGYLMILLNGVLRHETAQKDEGKDRPHGNHNKMVRHIRRHGGASLQARGVCWGYDQANLRGSCRDNAVVSRGRIVFIFPVLELIAQAAFSAIFAVAFAGTMLVFATGVLVHCLVNWRR